MPNFEAIVRTTFRDVAGLVLSCAREDLIEDPSNPGFAREWINRAPGLPSKPAFRQPGEPPPTYLGGRYSNPKQIVQAAQPVLLGLPGAQFQRSPAAPRLPTFFETEFIQDAFPDATPGNALACAYEFTKGADVSNNQVIFATDGALVVSRRNGAGDARIATSAQSVTVAGDHDDGTFLYTGLSDGTGQWELDNSSYGVGTALFPTQIPTATRLLIGRDAGGNHLDGILDAIHIWGCELSPKTRDLIWQTLDRKTMTDHSADTRAVMENAIWTDATGDPSLDQFNRLRAQTGLPHRFIKVVLPSQPALHNVQIACAVNGIVEPDARLGGNTFTYFVSESPPSPKPIVTPETDWSAVVDLNLRVEGHYTITCSRLNGGGVILHFDVEIS